MWVMQIDKQFLPFNAEMGNHMHWHNREFGHNYSNKHTDSRR